MPPHLDETLVALSSAGGGAARAVVRLSGPASRAAVQAVWQGDPPRRGRVTAGAVRLPGVGLPLPADLYLFPAPHSYTGQDVAELHTLGCPPLVEALVARLLEQPGCRAAGPGEFTLRAFLAGKLDLTRAEAVHAVVEAEGRADLRQALTQLAGGMATPLQALREDLLDLLADVEAGLDFADEDLQFVDPTELLLRLGRALAQVTLVGKQLDSRALAGASYRIVLTGRPNAGKSSLFNRLAGATALVSAEPGTTRDYLTATLTLAGVKAELVDTPGWQPAAGPIETQAQTLGRTQQREADLVVLCVEAGAALLAEDIILLELPHPPVLPVATKADLAASEAAWLATSAATGAGIEALRQALAAHVRARATPPLAPSASRCRGHVTRCLEHLRRAHAIVLEADPPEILALELREALEQLGAMVGAVYTDDLLDRVFSRFCIGK